MPVRPPHPLARSTARPNTRQLFDRGEVRYRLDVAAVSVADAVTHAGGWLFDRAVAGWHTTVFVAEAGHDLPLRILGVDMVPLDEVLADGGRGRQPHAVAMSGALCRTEPRAREGLQLALDDGGIEVVVWGAPADVSGLSTARHRLSIAARAFKSRAMAAAGIPGSGSAFEQFDRGSAQLPPVGGDLIS